MKKIALLLIVLMACLSQAQDSENQKQSSTSRKYHEYRLVVTEPAFHLAKIKAAVTKIRADKEGNRRMAEKAYNELTFEEKFTYNMIHGEDSSQNCDGSMATVREETKIFGYFPDAFSEGDICWSERQREFLTRNRSKVISLLRSTLKLRERAGVNLKNAVLEIKAYELIPDLISTYNIKKKDLDVLSLLMLLMKEDKFPEFMKSASYEKLYGENANYKNFLEANTANRDLIFERATAYYKSKVK